MPPSLVCPEIRQVCNRSMERRTNKCALNHASREVTVVWPKVIEGRASQRSPNVRCKNITIHV